MGYRSMKPAKNTYYYLKTNKAEDFCVSFQAGSGSESNPYCLNSVAGQGASQLTLLIVSLISFLRFF